MQAVRTTGVARLSASTALHHTPLWCAGFNPRFPSNPPESQLNRACELARRGRRFLSTKRGGRITRRGTERFLAVAKAAEGFSECPANSSDGTMRPLREGGAGRKKRPGTRCGKSMRMDGLHPRMVMASGDLATSLALRGPSRATLDRAPRRNVTSVLSGTYEAAKSGNRLRRFLLRRAPVVSGHDPLHPRSPGRRHG